VSKRGSERENGEKSVGGEAEWAEKRRSEASVFQERSSRLRERGKHDSAPV